MTVANLEQLRQQAEDLLRDYRSGVPAARQRLATRGVTSSSPTPSW